MALDGLSAMDKIEAVTLGIVVQPDEIQGWFRLMSHSLAHSLQLKSLSIVWINAPESFETIVNGNARICRDAAKIDLIIDMSSYASWLSVAEIQTTFASFCARERFCPILLAQVRWSRLLGHLAEAGADERVKIEPKGAMTRISTNQIAFSIPSVAPVMWQRTLDSIEKVVMPAYGEIIVKKKVHKENMAMIPMRAIAMSLEQHNIVCVFDEPLDHVCERLSMQIQTQSTIQSKQALVAEWNDCLPTLGMISYSVWVHDPMHESRGVWQVSLNSWPDGVTTWPV